ncbi:DUF1014-domain-containing protein [Auriscalpium vulgare]|uniref:DUF1014-domain-containing protein n=1 Tax=Auriscalpium vulgare TaxID=40419 RepID=A0ACB8RTP3_9AGAM|nr:DUF1014-domain-containing protein [Auriscalpium vulgare]
MLPVGSTYNQRHQIRLECAFVKPIYPTSPDSTTVIPFNLSFDMAPKGGNAKKEGGRAKKAENEAKKQQVAADAKERTEASKWSDGAKSAKASKEEKEEKRLADLARKAENARLLAEEEKATPVKKAAPKAGAKKAAAKSERPAGPGAIAAGGGLAATETGGEENAGAEKEVESYAATGIDNALDLLEVVTAKMDKASVGNQAAGIERHPERRFKASFEAYQERELPNVRSEVGASLSTHLIVYKYDPQHPGLRLQQYKDLLFKQFQKSPENPCVVQMIDSLICAALMMAMCRFNQVTVAYDASKDDKVSALKKRQTEVAERLRDSAN